jgi:phosphate transport system permease protein
MLSPSIPRRTKIRARRKRVNQMPCLWLSLAAMAFGLFWLVWILWETVRLGVGGLALAPFTEMTPPPNEVGGPGQCHLRLVMMVSLATFWARPIGIMAGIYLAEYDPKGWLAMQHALSTTSCCRRRRS